MRNHCPCHVCVAPKRKMYCHSHCDEYAKWAAIEQEKKDKKRAEVEAAHTNHPNKENALRKKMKWK